jgi:hypothetical protein
MMDLNRIVSELDVEIARLQRIRSALTDGGGASAGGKKRGRPKGSKNATLATPSKKARKLTPEGRKRIADAMKRRWAERRKATQK